MLSCLHISSTIPTYKYPQQSSLPLLAVFFVSPTSLSSPVSPPLSLLQNACEVCGSCDWELLLKSGIDTTERCCCGGDVLAGTAALISPSLPSFLPFLLSILQVPLCSQPMVISASQSCPPSRAGPHCVCPSAVPLEPSAGQSPQWTLIVSFSWNRVSSSEGGPPRPGWKLEAIASPTACPQGPLATWDTGLLLHSRTACHSY